MNGLEAFIRFICAGTVLCLGTAVTSCAQQAEQNGPAQRQAQPRETSPPNAANDPARVRAQAQTQQTLEQQRRQAEQDARKNLDQDAIAAISETRNAIKAIASGQSDQALAAIERAAGKIDIL